MNVQELIDKLQGIEDKTLPVCIADWQEGYMPPMEFIEINIIADGKFCIQGDGCLIDNAQGVFLQLGESL